MAEPQAVNFLDIVDIEEHLSFQCPAVQTKGFVSLAGRLLAKNLSGEDQKAHLKVYFDCYHAFGTGPLELLLDSLPHMVKKKILLRKKIMEEFESRINKMEKAARAFGNIVETCEPTFSEFLLLAAKMNNDALMTLITDPYMSKRIPGYIIVLLFTGILSDEQKRHVASDNRYKPSFLPYHPKLYPHGSKRFYEVEKFLEDCSPEELNSHHLNGLTIFDRHRLMQKRPNLLRNLNLKSHTLYMPFMFVMANQRKIYAEAMKIGNVHEQVLEVRTQITACQEQTTLEKPDFTKFHMSLERFLSHVINNEKIPTFVRFVEHMPDAIRMLEKPYIMPMLTCLLPHTSDESLQKRICELTVSLVKKAPEQADAFALYYMSLIAKPFFTIPKQLAMETLVELALHKFVLDPIVKFICIIAQNGASRILALQSLSKLVLKHPMIVETVSKCINFDESNTSLALFQAKLDLARDCCIATDDCDDVLSSVSKLLSGNSLDLSMTIDTVREIAKNDVLELKICRRLALRKVHLPGNSKALAAYCRLLALGAIPNSEETDEANGELKMDCIKELYELTKHQEHEVVSEAWKALGDYEAADIEEAVPSLTPSAFGAIYAKLHGEEQAGFVDFLQKIIGKEVDSYQRPLYNVGVQAAEVPPLLAKVDGYKDQLMTKNKDETWFWSATLPLCGSILQSAAPSNKVLTANRLLKSCLQMVPEATSQEEMLRLMAGWRIFMREMVTAQAESQNNNYVVARDQICQEGRLCLTQKSESVDNIMMMLTVMVEVIEERIRTIDDQKQADELAKAQKPWIISVFEFIATRLPKDVKQRRGQKVNPIYQVLTHSNKSSLFTALFCIRLLHRNPSILEFYGDGSDLELVPDRVFSNLLQDSSIELKEEDVPDRKMLWITTEAYGADEMTAKSFETNNQSAIDAKTGDVAEPILESPEHIEKFFEDVVLLPKEQSGEVQRRSRKTLEKLWNNGTEAVKQQIYKGLAELALVSGSGWKRAKTIPIDKLPDSSVLKSILLMFDEKHNVDVAALRKLFRSFANQKRKDGRYLPPVDWLKLLERVDWKTFAPESEFRLAAVALSCEQNIAGVIFHVAEQLSTEEILVVSEHLQSVAKILPKKQFEEVLRQMIRRARLEKDPEETQKIADAVAANQKNPLVRMLLIAELPTLESTIEVTDPIVKALKEPGEFGGGVISKCFDAWLEARGGDKMNMKKICDIVNAEEVEKRALIYALVSHEARRLSSKKRFEKILDVITDSRIARSSSKGLSVYLPLVLSLIICPTDAVDIPVCWFDNEDNYFQMLIASRLPFLTALIEDVEMKSNVKHIGSFLRPYVEGAEAHGYEQWQRVIASEFLIHLSVAFPADAIPNLLHESDAFWKTILPV